MSHLPPRILFLNQEVDYNHKMIDRSFIALNQVPNLLPNETSLTMKKYLQTTFMVLLALAFSISSFAQTNAIYPANSVVPGFQNSTVGLNAGNALNAGTKYNTFTGAQSGLNVVNSAGNSYYGTDAGINHEGEVNTFIGYGAGSSNILVTSNNSTYLGSLAGSRTSGNGNVLIGFRAGANLGVIDNQLYINNTTGTPLIYGDFDADVAGINTTAPLGTFDVRGTNLLVTDVGTTAANFINSRAAAVGQAGGPPGTSPCSLYGFRAQTDLDNAINVGMDANIPTILWGSTTDDLTFAFRNPPSSSACSTRLLRLGRNVAGTGYQLIFEGSGRVSGSWLVLSDKRIKKDVKAIPNALDLVQQLNGVTYSYNTDRDDAMILPEGKVYGFIAQEVQEVIPEVTSQSKEDGLIGIKYTELIPVLTEAIKEQQVVIDDQATIIENQEEKIASLEDRLAAIEKMLMLAERPEMDVRMIPVGDIISKILTDVIPGAVPFTSVYEDSAPHGRPTLYFLAGVVTYMALYEEKVPSDYMPDATVHPGVRANLDDIVDFAWDELNAFDEPSGRSRVFYSISTSQDEVDTPQWTISPNPVRDVLRIQCDEEVQRVVLSDLEGRTILEESPRSRSVSLQLSDLTPGVYLVKGQGENGSFSQKIIKVAD